MSLRRPPTFMPWTPCIPAGDDLPLAELELERLAAIPRGVELLARGEGDTDVVHRDLRALRRLVSVADDDVVDPELEGDVALGLVDLRSLGCHWAGTLPRAVVTIDEVRALAVTLPRSSEAFVRGRVKFRIGRIVYLSFSRDGSDHGLRVPQGVARGARRVGA